MEVKRFLLTSVLISMMVSCSKSKTGEIKVLAKLSQGQQLNNPNSLLILDC